MIKKAPTAGGKKTKKPAKKVHLEIERKFLLRRLPIELLQKYKHETLYITQYYFEIDGIWQRFRISTNRDSGKTKYIHTIKKALRPGVYEEDEKSITKLEFKKLYSEHKENCLVIEKTRYVVKYKGLKFEIDSYENLCLTILEVELPKLSFKFDFPIHLSEEIIMEATGNKNFSNFSLALAHKPGELFFKQHK
jgi:CYTH domain-containing protein